MPSLHLRRHCVSHLLFRLARWVRLEWERQVQARGQPVQGQGWRMRVRVQDRGRGSGSRRHNNLTNRPLVLPGHFNPPRLVPSISEYHGQALVSPLPGPSFRPYVV
jgi:hypothetical protein